MKGTGLLLIAVLAAPGAAQRPSPWIDSDTRAVTDNQPRTHIATRLEYNRYLSDNVGVAFLADVEHAFSDDVTTTTTAPGIMLFAGMPSLRLGTSITARALLGTPDVTPVLWLARANLNLGRGVQLRARAERDRYVATTASIDTAVLMRAFELMLDRGGEPGWAGALLARREDAGDDNPTFTAFGWLLVPVVRRSDLSLRLGYAAAWQDAEETRWTAVADERPPQGQGAIVPGHYDPYFTPHDQSTHSLLVDAAIAAGRGWVRLSGAAGRGSELAPALRDFGAPGATLEFSERTFTPYRAGASWWTPLGAMASFTFEVEYTRTAFYDATRARARIARNL
jgi:hypothetical protein